MSERLIRLNTVAFVDAANIIYGAKRESGFKVDLKKLARYLRTRFGAKRIFFYGGVDTRRIDYGKYEKMLKNFGYIPRLKKTKFYAQKERRRTFICRYCRKRNVVLEKKKKRAKANCDVDLAVDVLDTLVGHSRFIFLTGDGDFEPLMQKVRDSNKDLYVIASSKKTTKIVRKIAAEKFIEIRNLKSIIALTK